MPHVVDQRVDVVGSDQGHHSGMSQIRILVGVFRQQVEEGGDRFPAAQLAQSDCAEGARVQIAVAGQSDECLVRAPVARVAQHGRGHGAYLLIGVRQEGNQAFQRLHSGARHARVALGACDLSDTPDAMQTGLKGFAGEGRLEQGLVVLTRGQLKLRTQSDPVIGVQEPLGQFAGGSL